MAHLLIPVIQRRRPREGWLLTLIPLAVLLMAPLSAEGAAWVPGLGVLLSPVAVAGYLAARGLARRDPQRWPGWLAAIVLGVLGGLTVSLLAGWGDAAPAPASIPGVLVPLARFGLAVAETGQRLAQWVAGIQAGHAAQDDLIFGWLLGLVVWAAAAWAGWWLFRKEQPAMALLPAGVLLATNAYFYWNARFWLPLFVGCMIFVLMLSNRYALERRWQRTGMDYSEDVRFELILAALGISFFVTAVGLTMPRVVLRPTSDWFQMVMREPSAAVAETGKQLFPGLRRRPNPLLGSGGAAGSLPRSYLLTSGTELGKELVLRVSTDELGGLMPYEDPPASAQHYWRALTYDTYDGRGWSNGPTVEQELGAGAPLGPETLPARRPLRQFVEVMRPGDRALYAAGEPLAVNRPIAALVRNGVEGLTNDLVAFVGSGKRYEIVSLVPAASEATLRAAGAAYPPAIVARYLALPEMPARVAELAQQVAGAAATPYDQAVALQTFLRTYTYDLSVGAPPPGRDVADFFLFDSKAGYCDYYATAMVVMARSLGIPARLASGYATGTYNRGARTFMVYEDSAHSWPELYFPNVGWVPFEPTAVRDVPERLDIPGQPGQPAVPPEQVAADLEALRQAQVVRQRQAVLAGLLIAALAAVLVWLLWWRRRPVSTLVDLYQQLGGWGRRLGRSPGPGDTAGEFGRRLSQLLATRGGPRGQAAAQGVAEFVQSFEAAQYSPQREEPARLAVRTWSHLQPLFRRLWLRRFVPSAWGPREEQRPTSGQALPPDETL